MRDKKRLSRIATAAAALMALGALGCLPVEAQFFKKISKGLEKVNKGLEEVEKIIPKQKDKKKDTPEQRSRTQSDPGHESSASRTDAAPERKLRKTDWRSRTPTPHLTAQTRFLHRNVDFDNLPIASEGIFYIQEYNRSIGYSSYYGFWTIDGRRLFPAIYEGFTKEQPRFDSGACVVKATGTQRHSPTILYADGTARALSHEWEAMTQFYDGVAMVREIKASATTNLFYINTKGERIWPHLAETPAKGSIAVEMRPLREDRRAYFSNADRAWGFLDANGKIAVKPVFSEVRDFSGGYALAIPKGSSRAIFIDRSGAAAAELSEPVSSLMYATHISDVCDGCYAISEGTGYPTTFYNLKGKALRTYPGGASGFADGHAFHVNEKYGQTILTVNRSFNITGEWPFETSDFPADKPTFATVPYYTYRRSVTINTDGDPVMYVPGGIFSNHRLGQFSPEGYASAQSEFSTGDGKSFVYTGYVDTEGRYLVAFSSEEAAGGPFSSRLPGPGPIPEEPVVGLPPVDTIPEGPRGGGEAAVRYRVNVAASPANGGTVYGSGDYAYGDTVRVTGRPAEGFRITAVKPSRPDAATKTFNKFVVKGDMDITCHFTEEIQDEPVAAGIMEGTLPGYGLPVYLRTDGQDNRYSAPTRGFLAIPFEGDFASVESDPRAAASLSVNFFFVPMNVLGIQHDGDKEYLRLDGGIFKYANLKVNDNSPAGMLNNPLMTMMMAFDGADSGELQGASYRVEILEGAPDGETMRLGLTQRFSPAYGWIDADDPSFRLPLGGFFIRRVDKGLGADFFDGVTLRRCEPREVEWEPGEDFCGTADAAAAYAARLGLMFRKATAATPLSDYDMKQFSSDLDNNLFRMKP